MNCLLEAKENNLRIEENFEVKFFSVYTIVKLWIAGDDLAKIVATLYMRMYNKNKRYGFWTKWKKRY